MDLHKGRGQQTVDISQNPVNQQSNQLNDEIFASSRSKQSAGIFSDGNGGDVNGLRSAQQDSCTGAAEQDITATFLLASAGSKSYRDPPSTETLVKTAEMP